ncbi:hypothetical protein HY448_00585 [Candidatus Pacearchaeota archaeon]|nr:hypothetical protein [Candidatus Pacearchaeota archaeon]
MLLENNLQNPSPSKISKKSDPLGCYLRYYFGVSRGKLCQIDSYLYGLLRARKLLGQIPLRTKNYGDNPLLDYRKNHRGDSRSELYRKNWSLYKRLKDGGFLKYIPLVRLSKIQIDPNAEAVLRDIMSQVTLGSGTLDERLEKK